MKPKESKYQIWGRHQIGVGDVLESDGDFTIDFTIEIKPIRLNRINKAAIYLRI